MKRANKNRVLVLGLLYSLCFFSCEDNRIFLTKRPNPKIRAKPPKTTKLTSPKPIKEYTSIGKMDPFSTYDMRITQITPVKAVVAPKPKKKKQVRDVLRTVEVSQVKVIGILTGTSSPLATVKAPNGQEFVLRLGSYVGKNNGRVTSILPTGLVVTESFRNPKTKRLTIGRKLLRLNISNKKGNYLGKILIGKREAFIDKEGRLRFYEQNDSN